MFIKFHFFIQKKRFEFLKALKAKEDKIELLIIPRPGLLQETKDELLRLRKLAWKGFVLKD